MSSMQAAGHLQCQAHTSAHCTCTGTEVAASLNLLIVGGPEVCGRTAFRRVMGASVRRQVHSANSLGQKDRRHSQQREQ